MFGSSKPKLKPAPAPPKVVPVPTTPPPTYTATFHFVDGSTAQHTGVTGTQLSSLGYEVSIAWAPGNAAGSQYSAVWNTPTSVINLNQVTRYDVS